jgi:hypothetical protein
MAPQTFEYFFDLPPELRDQILEHICVFPSGILVGGSEDGGSVCLRPARSAAGPQQHGTIYDGDNNNENNAEENQQQQQQPADPPINLFLASPILYRDAGDLYYGRNLFHLDVAAVAWGRRGQFSAAAVSSASSSSVYMSPPSPPHSSTAASRGRLTGHPCGVGALMRLLTHPDTAGARRRMRGAVVRVRRLGGLVTDVLAPALGDMVLNGALRGLSVDVVEVEAGVDVDVDVLHESRGAMQRLALKWTDYSKNPALRALLVLLADPDMERAVLRVPRGVHAWFWCRFHEGGGSGAGDGDGNGGGHGGRRGCAMSWVRDGGLVEVDIHKLVDACAGDSADFRIIRVEEQGRR